MQNLIYLFIRYGGFITFLLLEGLCFYLIIQFNKEKNKIFFHSANVIAGEVTNRFDNLTDYLELEEQRDSIARENGRLRAMLGLSRFDIALNLDTITQGQDTQRYVYIEAEVINSSTQFTNNHFTLAKGSRAGVKPRMGVVGPKGIVGIVQHVSPNFCHVYSILHSQMKISVRHHPSGYTGSLIWPGEDPAHMRVLYIPKSVSVQPGDSILTSGYSTHFPPDILVGIVDTSYTPSGSSTMEIDLQLIKDLRSIRYAYIVNDVFSKEIRELENRSDE